MSQKINFLPKKFEQNLYSFEIKFFYNADFIAAKRLIFCSILLHSLSPNRSGKWERVAKSRVDACIQGLTKNIEWCSPSQKILLGKSKIDFDEKLIINSINNIIGYKRNDFSRPEYLITIVHNNHTYNYKFDNRSRALVAFCILWDKKDHPRDHLELSMNSSKDNFLLEKSKDFNGKYYGDPSKTIDELRNQGFPRQTDKSPRGKYINVTRKEMYGTKQEHYQLIEREQSLLDKVGRSQIPKSYAKKLYEKHNYQCNNCMQVYEENYLAPDHRVPSIVEEDNLSTSNYLLKLQTLCVRCNQVKREACKKCPINHKCSQCSWAYPEKFNISMENLIKLKNRAERQKITINNLIQKLLN